MQESNEKKHNYFYKTTNLINGKYYYGIHSTNKLNDGYIGSGRVFISAVKKYGKENFKKEIIADYPTRKEASDHEKLVVTPELIELDECYNFKSGGENGIVFSTEHRQKMRNSHIGNKHSEETKLKISIAQKGEKGNNFGKKASEETKAKLRMASVGRIPKKRNLSEEELIKNRNQPTCKPCEINGVKYISVRDASRQLNISRTTIRRRLLSNSKQFKDWNFI